MKKSPLVRSPNQERLVCFVLIKSHAFAIVFSFVVGFGLLGGGAVSVLGSRHYRRLQSSVLVWFSMAYVAASPLCCVFGLVVTGWSLYAWNRPEVKAIRTPLLPSS